MNYRRGLQRNYAVLVQALLIVELLGGCGRTPTSGWFIASWENGIFTIQNEGYTYKATCDGGTTSREGHLSIFSPDGTVSRDGKSFVALPPRCEAAIALVGHEVPHFDPQLLPAAGNQKDADGWIVTMAHSGSSLMLRRRRDEHTNIEELFKITSVTKTTP
jgi:hypothetical protein